MPLCLNNPALLERPLYMWPKIWTLSGTGSSLAKGRPRKGGPFAVEKASRIRQGNSNRQR